MKIRFPQLSAAAIVAAAASPPPELDWNGMAMNDPAALDSHRWAAA